MSQAVFDRLSGAGTAVRCGLVLEGVMSRGDLRTLQTDTPPRGDTAAVARLIPIVEREGMASG